MAHRCTHCGELYLSVQSVVSGCEECGEQKFQYVPDERIGEANDADADTPDTDVPDIEGREWPETATEQSIDDRGAANTGTGGADAESDRDDAGDSDTESLPGQEDRDDDAQAHSRSVMVDADELRRASSQMEDVDESSDDDGIIVAEPDEDAALDDRDEVKKRLNEQFGSIKIVEPGKFELDLMEMYESDDYIITLGEDGKYAVESMSTWKPGRKSR